MSKQSINYEKAGVSIDTQNEVLKEVKEIIKKTHNKFVIKKHNDFGGIYNIFLKMREYKFPYEITTIDGVGTKSILADQANSYYNIGRDIVSHCANDLLCSGSTPIYFLDYLAFDVLKPQIMLEIVKGMAFECEILNIPIIGGETAEMPDVYKKNQYDVVGKMSGVVESGEFIEGKNIQEGDIIIGLASNGPHTNGYSLIRKIIDNYLKKNYPFKSYSKKIQLFLKQKFDGDKTFGESLLMPHTNYSPAVLDLIKKVPVKGIAHITGGGFVDNISRILPESTCATINKKSWNIPQIFKWIKHHSQLDDQELYKTFNMGIGLVLIADKNIERQIINHESLKPFNPSIIGKIDKRDKEKVLLN